MSDQIVLHGDSLEVLKDLPDNSVDSVVTDPPYGLSFMGKKWDYDVPSVALWTEVLRVLKPGGHLLSFGGTRTYHRMVVAIEDAGFEIRDQIQWLYGSGFPKSHNLEGQWEGWGTALKPANEPIVLARKPLAPKHTVAENVAEFGTGALNIDASRIAYQGDYRSPARADGKVNSGGGFGAGVTEGAFDNAAREALGRWPANIILDEAAAEALDEQSGTSGGGKRKVGSNRKPREDREQYGDMAQSHIGVDNYGDSGGASRFFYVAKASKRERGTDNNHPTVKPIALMQYLIKLVTPPNGTVLDPFTGSGTTGVAAAELGFDFIGIEREAEYVAIAQKRIDSKKGKDTNGGR